MSHYIDEEREKTVKVNTVFKILICILFIVFAALTLNNNSAYDVVSIALSFSCAILLLRARNTMGKFWTAGVWCFFGTAVWCIADIVWFLAGHVLPASPKLDFISSNIYLIPDYLFLIGLIFYVKDRLNKNIFYMMMINAFLISVALFIISQRTIDKLSMAEISVNNILVGLYSYFVFFTMILLIATYIKTGIKKHARAFYFLTGFLFLYNLMECRYTWYLIINRNPESPFVDAIFLLCIAAFAVSFADTKIPDFVLQEENEEAKSTYNPAMPYTTVKFRHVVIINSIVIMVATVILYLVHLIDMTSIFYLIIATLVYIIMCITLKANILSEELLVHQKEETARLEKMVAEKTKELREMNEYLEKISNTDALTGLYNRRYGVELLNDLVKEAENYPIALFSLDLNYFKPINDNYGHDMGDVVLQEVGKRLARLKEERCTAVRMGGDEFLVIFRNSNDTAVNNLAKLICEKMDEPIEATVVDEEKGERHHTFQISAGIGIASFPGDAEDVETLYKMADDALYAIKHKYEKSAYILYKNIPKTSS